MGRGCIGPISLLAAVALVIPGQMASADVDLPPSLTTIVNGDVTSYQWMLESVNAPEAWSQATGEGVRVAVIDTGIDSSHPDLTGQVGRGAQVIRTRDDGLTLVRAGTRLTSRDQYGHGTAVAAIIAADRDGNGMTGIAPDAELMPIQLESVRMRPLGFVRMVAKAVRYATRHGADVINLSLGMPTVESGWTPDGRRYENALTDICRAIGDANDRGAVVVTSAGNEGDWGNVPLIPAACHKALTVSAVDSALDRTYWSSFGGDVDVAAPGALIVTARSQYFFDYAPTPHLVAGGTSMASPVVAGVVALVRERYPSWSARQIMNKIRQTSHDLGVPGQDPDTGMGIVDAAAAVGVGAAAPGPVDYLDTWAWRTNAPKAMVSWTTTQVRAALGYTVSVFREDGTVDTYDFDGDTVRAVVRMKRTEGWNVTAHTSSGDVATYPRLLRWRYRWGGVKPERLHVTGVEREGNRVMLSIDRPDAPRSIDVVRLYTRTGVEWKTARWRIDHQQPFPRVLTFRLSPESRWYDLNGLGFEVTNKDRQGGVIGGAWYFLHRRAAALHGSRVEKVLAAGRHAVEVTGGVSEIRATRACGRSTCQGEHATLVIDRGRSRERISVRFTAAGHFHATIWIPAGATHVKLRIEGPRYLDSGQMKRMAIRG
jgi:subtilisin family serine protease